MIWPGMVNPYTTLGTENIPKIKFNPEWNDFIVDGRLRQMAHVRYKWAWVPISSSYKIKFNQIAKFGLKINLLIVLQAYRLELLWVAKPLSRIIEMQWGSEKKLDRYLNGPNLFGR